MNWRWHPAGTRKLPDGRMHGSSFRYQMCPRHGTETYSCTVTVQGDGKVYVPPNMMEYKKPTILDISPVDVHLVETRSGNACYGASGISHSMATTQLIACAAANAIDRWIAPPLTPDKVLKALGKA